MDRTNARHDPRVGALVWRAGLHLLALLVVVEVLRRGFSLVKLATVAAVLAAAAESPVEALRRRGWRRGLAIAAVLGGAFLVIAGAVAAAVPVLVEQVGNASDRLPKLLEEARASGPVAWLDRRFGLEERVTGALKSVAPSISDAAKTAATTTAGVLSGIVTVVALIAFLLVSTPRLWRSAIAWVHPGRRAEVDRVGKEVRSAVAGYMVGVLAVALFAGVLTGVTTALLGVPFALPLAVAAAVLSLVPYVGAISAAALVAAATFLTAGTTAGLVAVGVFLAYQQLEGAVLEPLIQRRAISIDPLVVIASLLLGLAAFGVWGGFMALPVAATAKVLASHALERRRARWRAAAIAEAAAEDADAPGPGPEERAGPPH